MMQQCKVSLIGVSAPAQVLHAALGNDSVEVRLAAMRATTAFIMVCIKWVDLLFDAYDDNHTSVERYSRKAQQKSTFGVAYAEPRVRGGT